MRENKSRELMRPITLGDDAWNTTFPHRVMPLRDEWLPGLLLRCDEANGWQCRTTLTHLLAPGPEKFHRCWRTETPNLIVIQPSSLKLDYLSQLLALPMNILFATTYHLELARLYGTTDLHPKFMNEAFTFHLCPECLTPARLLRRSQVLPYITLCQEHGIALLAQCQCGTPLQLFHRQIQPFTCYTCGRDWAELPRIEAVASHLTLEQNLLLWYEFFFSQGTPPIMQAARQLMTGSIRKTLSLGLLVALLVQRRRSPQDVLRWADRLSRQLHIKKENN